MDYLEEINNKVNLQLKLKSKEVILTSLQTLVNKHNELCDCNYCILLSEYVSLKKLNTKLERLDRKGEFVTPYLLRNKERIVELKIAKDLLKQL